MKKYIYLKKIAARFKLLSQREKLYVGMATSVMLLLAFYYPLAWTSEYLELNQINIAKRNTDLEQVNKLLVKYKTLNHKFDEIVSSFNQAQMTFEQVTNEIDKIVQDSIGNNKYEFTKIRQPSEIGQQFEKQDYTLKIRTITLEQLVKLLYKIEHDSKSIFLGKIDLKKNSMAGNFDSVLDIFSINKKSIT